MIRCKLDDRRVECISCEWRQYRETETADPKPDCYQAVEVDTALRRCQECKWHDGAECALWGLPISGMALPCDHVEWR